MLSDTHKEVVLTHLNDICPDTFDEGEFGPWTFTGLTRDGSTWTVSFENALGDESAGFDYDGDCVDERGVVDPDFFEQLSGSISAWEDTNRE